MPELGHDQHTRVVCNLIIDQLCGCREDLGDLVRVGTVVVLGERRVESPDVFVCMERLWARDTPERDVAATASLINVYELRHRHVGMGEVIDRGNDDRRADLAEPSLQMATVLAEAPQWVCRVVQMTVGPVSEALAP